MQLFQFLRWPIALLFLFVAPGVSIAQISMASDLMIATPGLNQNEHTFSLPGLTATADVDDKYKAFLFYGDGNFDLKEMSDRQSESFDYVFPKAGTYNSFIETTSVYDDGNNPPPKRHTASANTVLGNSSVTPFTVIMGTKNIHIQPVRKMVPGHEITYIITIKDPGPSDTDTCGLDNTLTKGKITFNYDSDVLSYDGYIPYEKDKITTTTYQPGTIEINITDPPKNGAHNIFLRLHTKDNTLNRILDPLPTAYYSSEYFNADIKCAEFAQVSDICTAQAAVEASHDPNKKTITPNNCALDYNGNFVFTIEFQNDGPNPAKTVTITDDLDFIWDRGCSNVTNFNINNITMTAPSQATVTEAVYAGGRLKIKLDNVNLRGLKEPGYGKDFFEPETKGMVQFTLPASCLKTSRPACNAMLNKAHIVFDCNPPVFTNFAFMNFNCYKESQPVPCNTCLDTAMNAPVVTQVGTPILPMNLPGFDRNLYTHFNWYPAQGLSAYNIYNPVLTDNHIRDYVLVASGVCHRKKVYVSVRPACNLAITTTITPKSASNTSLVTCPKNQVFDITAMATGYNNIYNLQWNNAACSTATDQIKMFNIMPNGLIYIAVLDKNTGCSAEKWIDLYPNPLVLDDDPLNCTADVIVSGGVAPYVYQWEWNGQNQALTTDTPVNMTGKTSVKVTVTDALGCEETFNFKCKQ